MLPSLSRVMPHGLLNSPSPLPFLPHWVRALPSVVKTCRRSLPLSTTITLPPASQMIPAGFFNSPRPLPGVPHLRMNLPAASKTETQFVLARTADLHAVDPHCERVLVTSIGDEDVAVISEAHGLWVIEPRAVRRGASDCVAPIVSAAFDISRKCHSVLPSRQSHLPPSGRTFVHAGSAGPCFPCSRQGNTGPAANSRTQAGRKCR